MQNVHQTTSKKALQLTAVSLAVLLSFACVGPNTTKDDGVSSNNNTAEQDAAKGSEQPEQDSNDSKAHNKLAQVVVARELKNQQQTAMHEAQAVQKSRFSNSALSTMQARPALAHSVSLPSTMQESIAYLNPVNTNSENYQNIPENSVKQVETNPVSTFSIDVDTGSYTNTRRMLKQGMLPPADAVRVEEFINYFDYDYPQPTDTDTPFSVNTALSIAPWDSNRHLLRIGLKGYEAEHGSNTARNLVFLLDVSGSMNQANKLPLLKRSLLMLTNQLTNQDSVSIVVYAGASGVVLEPTAGDNTAAISQALNALQAGGSTNGGAGIQQAYNLAEQAFKEDGVNRVILATDGDFNVGMTDQKALLDLIKVKKDKGIALTTLGFGQGNYNDYLMEQLADAGNGNYAYIDNINEARKVLVDELNATMQIIAKDVKIQVEFNPEAVAEYRLIGYENRQLNREDFNNDKVDAGDIGAGHRVTALYELSLVGSDNQYVDNLRYSKPTEQNKGAVTVDNDASSFADEIAFVKLRYKAPDGDTSKLISEAVKAEQLADFKSQPDDFRFATAVASFAQHLKSSKFSPTLDYEWIANTARAAKGEDEFGYRSEFVQLVENTKHLSQVN
jgi:Ca-activated chloride channel family protein